METVLHRKKHHAALKSTFLSMVVQQKMKFSNCDSTVDWNVLKEQMMFVFGSQFLIQLSGAADVTPSVLQCGWNVAEQQLVLFQMATPPSRIKMTPSRQWHINNCWLQIIPILFQYGVLKLTNSGSQFDLSRQWQIWWPRLKSPIWTQPVLTWSGSVTV